MANQVRWGRLKQIAHVRTIYDKRYKQPTLSKVFSALPVKLQQLSSWRRGHKIRTHKAVRSFARRKGYKPSSDIPLNLKLKFIKDRGG